MVNSKNVFRIFILKEFLFLFTVYGRDVKAVIEQPLEAEPMHPGKNTVTYESRLLKGLLLQLI